MVADGLSRQHSFYIEISDRFEKKLANLFVTLSDGHLPVDVVNVEGYLKFTSARLSWRKLTVARDILGSKPPWHV